MCDVPEAKRHKSSSSQQWLRSWAWKREHRPDKVRFDRPYTHTIVLPTGDQHSIVVHQQRFKEEGFASTVWDSSIVVAKWAERQGTRLRDRRVLDLSAGCGLVALVCEKLGASVVATDLGPNLPLLRKNAETNGCQLDVRELVWGDSAATALQLGPLDVIAACDVMYIDEAVPALVATLATLAGEESTVLVAHGRNRGAEPTFLEAAKARGFSVEDVPSQELDDTYQCADVTVLRLRKQSASARRTYSADQQEQETGQEQEQEKKGV